MAMSLKLKVFCALHRPQGRVQIGYHLCVISLSFVVGFCLNVLNLEGNEHSFNATMYIDSILLLILLVETLLQFWSSSYKPSYQQCLGKWRYLREHWGIKTVDVLGIITYFTFMAIAYAGPRLDDIQSNTPNMTSKFTPTLSVLHMLQILQIYRLTHRQVSLMWRTMHFQFGFLFSIVLFTVGIFLVVSRCIYLIEKDANKQITNIYDASWLVFVTIICIGFGDRVPVTTEGKLFMIFAAYYGVISFSILTSLFGAQLANEKEKPSIVSLMPAASLIQNVWILHTMDSDIFWKHVHKKALSDRDKRAIICLQKVRYLVSSRHFKLSQSDITAFDENMLLYEHLLNRLDFIEKSIFHNAYTLNGLNGEIERIEKSLNGSTGSDKAPTN